MSDEEERLIDAIIETPDDDAPRLVYADWLQSRGDPRGELIHLQCQLAAVPDDDRRRAIRIAENKLLSEHRARWIEPLRDALPAPRVSNTYTFEFVRGFVEEVTLTLEAMRHLDALFAVAPLVRTLRIVPDGFGGDAPPWPRPALGDVLDAPQLARIRSLDIGLGGGGNDVADIVASSPTLRDLRELKIGASVWGEMATYFAAEAEDLILDDAGAEALASSPHLAKLERLDLENNRMTAAGVRTLSTAAWRLRTLVLSHNGIEEAAFPAAGKTLVEAFASPAFAGLEVLGVAGIPFDNKSIAALVRGPHLATLRELDLEKCHLGADGTAALCDAFALPALRRLRLERNSLCDAGALAIADCAALANLTSFEAGHNRMGQKAAVALSSTPHFANLERLTLNEPRWKPEVTAMFAESPTLASTKIYLAGRLVARKKTKPYAVKPDAALRAAEPAPVRGRPATATAARSTTPARAAAKTKPRPATTSTPKPRAKPARKA